MRALGGYATNMRSLRPARLLAVVIVLAMAVLLLHGLAPEWVAKAEPRFVIAKIESFVAQHGLTAIFVGALVEALVLVSWYAPGSTVVLVGAVLAGRGAISFPLLIAVAGTGFLIGYTGDYLLGYHGWARVARYVGLGQPLRRMEKRVQHTSAIPFIFLFAHPHCGVLAATAAGVLRRPAKRVVPLLCCAAFLWTAVWGFIAFLFGRFIIDFINGPMVLVAVVGVALTLFLRRWKQGDAPSLRHEGE